MFADMSVNMIADMKVNMLCAYEGEHAEGIILTAWKITTG